MILGHHDAIDVIIPARGNIAWIQTSLSSIAAQSLHPTNVTLIDDGLENADRIEDLGKRLFGARFRLLKNQGQGVSAALNTGIQQSAAHWIARMDADDVAYPNRLEQQIHFLKTSSQDLLGCGTQVRFINSKGHELERSRLPLSWEDIAEQMLSRTCFIHPTLVMRRDALLRTPYRTSMDGAEDVDLLLRLSEQGQVLNLNQVLLDYRVHLSQESFRMRARHTAVQELAFRLALSRRKDNFDPLENDPELAERFIRWRLSTPGYVRCRTFLTALRYTKIHFSGYDMNGLAKSVLVGLKSIPMNPSAFPIAWRIFQKAGAGLLDETTPFNSLNLK
jgi:glycosyltransferase involved in cell wall biosynthesis